jgi:hypothetical protein
LDGQEGAMNGAGRREAKQRMSWSSKKQPSLLGRRSRRRRLINAVLARNFVFTKVAEPACRPVQEKSGSVIFQDAQDRPLPYKNGLNMSGIEENAQYMEQEEGKDCWPENASASVFPKGIDEDCKIERRENNSLR